MDVSVKKSARPISWVGNSENGRYFEVPYTVSVSFQPKIIMHALDNYAVTFAASDKKGPHQYPAKVYSDLGL